MEHFEKRISTFDKFLKGITLPDGFRDYLKDNGFFTAPASTKFHGNYIGGLFDHSLAVTKYLVRLTESNNLKWNRPKSPYIIGMFHDICKIDMYTPVYEMNNATPVKWEFNSDTLLKGHGDKSVMMLATHMELTEEEMLCIRFHMGAFTDKEEWSSYTKAIGKYPNVLWTHQADMLATHVAGI